MDVVIFAGAVVAEAAQCMVCCPQPALESSGLAKYFFIGAVGGLVVSVLLDWMFRRK